MAFFRIDSMGLRINWRSNEVVYRNVCYITNVYYARICDLITMNIYFQIDTQSN